MTINLKQIQIDPVKLKAAREQRLISQVLAAKAVGISQARLWNYENGEARIPGYLLARLCLLYGVQVTDLTNAGEIFLQNGSIAA